MNTTEICIDVKFGDLKTPSHIILQDVGQNPLMWGQICFLIVLPFLLKKRSFQSFYFIEILLIANNVVFYVNPSETGGERN